MTRLPLACVLWLLCCSLLTSQSEAPSPTSPRPTPQQQLVAALTGITPAVGETTLYSRWSAAERATARRFLQLCFADLDIAMREHAYVMPNVHAFQDLLLGPFRGVNLYGVLPAPTPTDEYVILGAHYDTERFAPGANDNASAIAVIYGAVRKLAISRPWNKNLLIVFFDQEEEENVGSRAFIKFLEQKDWRIHSVHTIDQLGWDKDGDRAIELELPDSSLVAAYEGVGRELNIPVHITQVSASDHQAFRAAGYVVTGITEEFANGDTSPFKDSAEDTYETVDFGYVESSTRLLTQVMSKLLNMP